MNCFNHLIGLAALLMAVSCVIEDCETCPKDIPQAEITVAVGMETSTKAPYLFAEPYEAAVNNLQILIFDSKGRLNAYKSLASASRLSVTTTYGSKTVWAVVNGPDLKHVKTLEALLATSFDLSVNSVSIEKGFVMTGSAEVDVNKADVTAYIDVRRLTSRVAICSITNSLPAAYPEMTVESVVLANVAGNQNVQGTAAISSWYNNAGTSYMYTPSCQELTYRKPDEKILNGQKHEEPYSFYSYPNSTERRTRLIVTAAIGSERYYYPVVLESLERNKAYTINMTITALGSDSPDKTVEKGTVTAIVNVLPWSPGEEYTETI